MFLIIGVCEASGIRVACLQNRLSYDRGLNKKTCRVIKGPPLPDIGRLDPNVRAESMARYAALQSRDQKPSLSIGIGGVVRESGAWLASAALLYAPHRPVEFYLLNERNVCHGQPLTLYSMEEAFNNLFRLVDTLCPLL
jgi:hypothetical protein